MFAIATEQQQYKTYLLSDSSTESQLTVVPERGAIITSWRVQNQELLYLDAERFANPNLSVRGGIPILFPICGNLPDNTYTYQGQQYTLKQHGFARDLPWLVTNSLTQDCASLTVVLNSNPETGASYPFDFELAFTYQLQGNTLSIAQCLTNQSTQPMPFSLGFHPYFFTPNKAQLQFAIPASEFQDQRTKRIHAFTGDFDFEQDEIDLAFRPLSARKGTVLDKQQKVQIELAWNDADYTTVVFWTLKGKNFYCLEPWTAPRNALNTGTDLLYLEPANTWKSWISLKATFL